MNLSKLIAISLFLLGAYSLQAQESALWTRYPSISPDGQTIAFCYKGDIYTVNSQGGRATQLTTHPGYDGYPCWSPDGKTIAFASDRNGPASPPTPTMRSPYVSHRTVRRCFTKVPYNPM